MPATENAELGRVERWGRFEPALDGPKVFDGERVRPDEGQDAGGFGVHQPSAVTLALPEGCPYEAEVVDTWNTTVTRVGKPVSGRATIRLPGQPYIAVRVRKAR